MAGLLTTSSIMMCPHGGMVQAITTNTKVKTTDGYILRSSDTFTIVGCTFTPTIPHPCVQVQWVQPALKSQVMSDFTLTEESVGLCVAGDLAVQGSVLINYTQSQVSGF
ncbi:MAG: hypothetical protein V7L26_04930 [Nostoc sp.]|uniref:hypothetical protein n=1 Tax=Nostoc sp. TaxID=1180 RepID=UPI002FF3D1A8